MRPSGPDVERRRQRGIADKAVDVRAITTSEFELSAPIDTEYAELAVRTLHTPYGLDARGEALLRRGGPNPVILLSNGVSFDGIRDGAVMASKEQEAMIRQYAAGDITWTALRDRGFENYVKVLAGLGELGLRPPCRGDGGAKCRGATTRPRADS